MTTDTATMNTVQPSLVPSSQSRLAADDETTMAKHTKKALCSGAGRQSPALLTATREVAAGPSVVADVRIGVGVGIPVGLPVGVSIGSRVGIGTALVRSRPVVGRVGSRGRVVSAPWRQDERQQRGRDGDLHLGLRRAQ